MGKILRIAEEKELSISKVKRENHMLKIRI
jgi:hypothetical protein